MIADTSGLLAYFNSGDPHHTAVVEVVDGLTEPMTVSPFVVAELDYLVMSRLGIDAEVAVLRELSGGALDIAEGDPPSIVAAMAVILRYRDQSIGLADAHQVVIAQQRHDRDILTLDRRHFDVLRPLQGGRFHLHPTL
jgi:predicted nucleic acid-binding protein